MSRERDTIFTMLTVPALSFSQPPAGCQAQSQNLIRLAESQIFKNHQNSQPIASGHDVFHTQVLFPIWGFYYDICDCHIRRARAWTPALRAEQFKA